MTAPGANPWLNYSSQSRQESLDDDLISLCDRVEALV
jgi:hypothetical protein